jgi:hypothetical protein
VLCDASISGAVGCKADVVIFEYSRLYIAGVKECVDDVMAGVIFDAR